MRAWWLATKKSWMKERAKLARQRSRAKGRLRIAREHADRVLLVRPVPSQWDPRDVHYLLAAQYVTTEYVEALNRARYSDTLYLFDLTEVGTIPEGC